MLYIPFRPIQRLCLPAFLLRLAAVEVVFSVIDEILYGHSKISDRVDTAVQRKYLILSLFPFLFQADATDEPTKRAALTTMTLVLAAQFTTP